MIGGRFTAGIAGPFAFIVVSVLPATAAPPTTPKAAEPVASRSGEPDGSPRNAVARARMLECGHQWNSLKKNGTASGTWKDFSRSCLAQR